MPLQGARIKLVLGLLASASAARVAPGAILQSTAAPIASPTVDPRAIEPQLAIASLLDAPAGGPVAFPAATTRPAAELAELAGFPTRTLHNLAQDLVLLGGPHAAPSRILAESAGPLASPLAGPAPGPSGTCKFSCTYASFGCAALNYQAQLQATEYTAETIGGEFGCNDLLGSLASAKMEGQAFIKIFTGDKADGYCGFSSPGVEGGIIESAYQDLCGFYTSSCLPADQRSSFQC